MKRNYSPAFVTLLTFFLLFSASCKKDTQTANPLLEEGYTVDEAGIIMTLAAIAYTAEGNTEQTIKDSIKHYLADQSLATAGQWELVWGPGINDINSNLVYVAMNSSTQPVSFAIAVRGTSFFSITDILQDFQVFTLVPFKYGLPGDSIAQGSMTGLDIILDTEDPKTGLKLGAYLQSIASNDIAKIYITGHSQGGALAPLLTYWFVTQSGIVDHFDLETYAFAGPSIGNQIFKRNFMNTLPPTAGFHMVSNSLDIVPYFWARFESLTPNNIPAPVPLFYQTLMGIASDSLQKYHIKYVQLDDQIDIGNFPPKDTLGTVHPSETLLWYNHWVMAEHTHNNYLKLLNVSPIH